MNHSEFKKLLEFRYKVYVEELGYLKPNENGLKIEKDRYDRYSRHIVLKDGAEIIACARIVSDSDIGLPVLNKISHHNMFAHEKKVEVGRLIIQSSYRKSSTFLSLTHEIFRILLSMDITYVLADTYKDSESYRILRSLGFKELDLEYHDEVFNLDQISTVLYFQINEMISDLNHSPNKKQALFMKYWK